MSLTGGKRRLAVAVAACAVLLALPLVALAGKALDKHFGKHGLAIAQVGNDGSGANLVKVAPNGSIIAAGMSVFAEGEDSEGHFVIARFTSKGKLDSGFGSKGSTIVDFGGGPLAFDVPYDMALAEDGATLVAGSAIDDEGNGAAGIARLDQSGNLDTAFDGDGMLATSPGGLEMASAILPLPQGAFYVIGPSKKSLEIARFNADGTLDQTFGNGGFTLTDLGRSLGIGHALLTDAGKILVVAFPSSVPDGDFGLMRFNADGTLDTTFGDGGIAAAPSDSAADVAQDSKGNLVVAGGRLVARFTADGKLDDSFADDGLFEFSNASGFTGAGMALGAKDSVVVSGTAKPTKSKTTAEHRFAVSVLTNKGRLNRKFGNRGFATDRHGDVAKAVTTQKDGKIVAAGRTFGRNIFIGSIAGRDTALMLARYLKP